MAAPRIRNQVEIRRLPQGAELVLADAGSWVLVLRGACVVRTSSCPAEPVQAGTLLLGAVSAQPVPDLRVAQALGLMCSQLEKRWTVESLARQVGLSRAAFAKRFVLSTGLSPLRYLCQLRLERAAELLRSSDACLGELSDVVGYASEFAFSRAFKRRYGVAPGVFRRRAATFSAPIALRCAA
jgi:transcriptional regulator GlxA family with amidase domain